MRLDPHADMQFVYVSELAPDADYRAVTEVLRRARRDAEAAAIRGALVCDGQRICSALCGDAVAVSRLSATLSLDRRHVRMRVLLHDQDQRLPAFADWHCGYVDAGAIDRVEASAPDEVWQAVQALIAQADLDDWPTSSASAALTSSNGTPR